MSEYSNGLTGPGALLSVLPDEAIAALKAHGVLKRYEDGQVIHAKGDPPTGLYGIVEGHVRVSNTRAGGTVLQVAVLGPGQWFGEISLFDGLPRTHDAHAMGDVALLVIDGAEFDALLERQPALYRPFIVLLCRRLRLAFAAFDDVAMLTLPQRLAKLLLSLAEDYGQPDASGTRIGLHLTQEELGQMLGVTRVSVGKLLKGWERDGTIALGYGRVVVIDPDALAALLKD